MSNAFKFHFQNLIHADPTTCSSCSPAPSIPAPCRTVPLLLHRRGGITDLKASSTAPIRQYCCSYVLKLEQALTDGSCTISVYGVVLEKYAIRPVRVDG